MIQASQINFSILPAIPLSERSDLPDCPAIYFVLSADDTVLYISKATSLVECWKAHHRYEQCVATPGARIAWLALTSAMLLDAVERACIAYFTPLFNRTTPIVIPQSGRIAVKIPHPHTSCVAFSGAGNIPLPSNHLLDEET